MTERLMPSTARSADYYALLGVAPNASAQQVRRAWLRLCKENHPDRFPSPGQKAQATRRLAAINAAYEELSDPRQRQQYDRQRSHALVRQHGSRTPAQREQAPPPVAQADGFGNRRLPHRYTPGGKFVVFDGITYMSVPEAARRLKQPEDRLRMYIDKGELFAVDFDNQHWVTEASLVPLRTRHKRHQAALAGPREWRKAVPHVGRPKYVPGAGPDRERTLGSRYESKRIDAQAEGVLSVAPLAFLLITGILLYCYLANFGVVWQQLQRLPQMFGG